MKKLRIFVSSVQKELETERVAVAGAVSSDQALSPHCEIVLFEKEALCGRKVAKPYLECLAGCDIYVLILDRKYGGARGTMSATHEEYKYAQERDMPMMIFVRGRHDAERQQETQAFFKEIKKDGHRYRRFHDRVDLLPEIKRGLFRIFRETFDMDIADEALESSADVGKASAFEQQILDVAGSSLNLDVALEWLRLIGHYDEKVHPTRAGVLNALREKGLVRKNTEGSGFKAMASGLLFLGKDPAQIFPQCRILADAYTGTESDPIPKDQKTFSGPAPRLIEQVVDFVMANTRHPIRVVGIHRVKLDEYPREVIREAIVNAIAHRDYEDAARPIYLKVFHDRVEILSPGNLVRPLTITKLVKGNYEPCSRNPTLAQYLGHMRLMEQRGTGIRRMHVAMVNHGLDAPGYAFRDGYFTVALKGPGDDMDRLNVASAGGVSAAVEERLTKRQREMVAWLAAGETITNRECQERLGVSKVTATKDLSTLVGYGLAERVGEGRSVRYVYSGGNR